jgi:hypothetical protein
VAVPRLKPGRLLAALLALWPAAGLGQALSAQLSEGLNLNSTTITDETGRQTRTDGLLYLQKYRLALDEPLYPLLRLTAGGNLDWTSGRFTTGGLTTESDDKKYTFFSGLRFGSPILNGGLDADYRSGTTESRQAGVTFTAPPIARLGLSAYAGWKPAELPALDLRLSHADTHDSRRAIIDLTSEDATLSLRYQPDPTVQLQYSLRGSDSTDHLAGVTNADVTNSVTATWSDGFAAGRGNAYVSYNLGTRAGNVTVTGAGGAASVLTRQFPVAGLSVVDGLTTTPDTVTLNPNDELIGADSSVSAGLNLGTSASSAVQGTPRELGARFADRITPVNVIELWVDRSVTSVATLFSFSVWRSDDGTNWTPLANPLAGSAVRYSQVPGQYYFDLDLPQAVQAQYLKVVVRPLPAAATSDPQLATIWVTKLRFFQAQAADQVRGRSFTLSGSLSASARYRILDAPALTFDSSLQVGHNNRSDMLTWAFLNGLSAQQRLSKVLAASGRADVAVSDAGRGRELAGHWSAALSAELLPTLGGGATYAGVWSKGLTGQALSQSLTAFGRAELYEGIAASLSGTANVGTTPLGQSQRGTSLTGSLSLVSNRRFSLTSSASWAESVLSGGGLPTSHDQRSQIDVAASLVPVQALSLTAGVTHYILLGRPQTLASFSAAFSPFQGGTLQLHYGYTETLDVAADTRTRTQGPGLRWNIRPSWFLDVGYSLVDITSPAQRIETQGLFANLLINLR